MKFLVLSLLFVASAIAKPHPHVIGGVDAALGQFPYQISFQMELLGSQFHICGGSILSPTWVVTAGHCVKGIPDFSPFHVVAGLVNLTKTEDAQDIQVVKQVVHPDFAGLVGPNDIALLQLETPLELNDNVQPISLPDTQAVLSGNVDLTGWGAINNDDTNNIPDVLQTEELPVLSNKECSTALNELLQEESPFVDASNVCTGPLDGGKGACLGDSGGPIAQDGKLVGIVTWGIIPCGLEGAPSVYTKVSNFIDFIKENVDDLPQ